MTSTVVIYFDWFLECIQYVYDFFARIGAFALTNTADFVSFSEGSRDSLTYFYRGLTFFGEPTTRTFTIVESSFLGGFTQFIGNFLSMLFPTFAYSYPLVITLLLTFVEWFFIASVIKFLVGLIPFI